MIKHGHQITQALGVNHPGLGGIQPRSKGGDARGGIHGAPWAAAVSMDDLGLHGWMENDGNLNQ